MKKMKRMKIFGYLAIIVAVSLIGFNTLSIMNPTAASEVAGFFDPVAYADGVMLQAMTIHLDDLSVRRSSYWTDGEVYFSHNSLPENDAYRVGASGFSDALTIPFSTWTDDFGFFGYDSLRNEVYEEIKTNPIYAYAVAKYLYDKELRTGDTLGSLNDDWMGTFIRRVETEMSIMDPNSWNYNPAARTYGWDFLIAYVNNGEAVLTDEYKVFSVHLRMLLDNFVVIGIYDNCNARESWALNPVENASLRLPIQVSYLDSLPGFVLAYERKDSFGARYFGMTGTYDCYIGFNRYDKRPVNPDQPGPKPTPQPTKQPHRPTPEPERPTPPPTRPPKPTPTPEQPTPTPTCPVITPTPTPWLPTPTPEQPTPTPGQPTPTCPIVTPTPTPTVTTPPPTNPPTPTPPPSQPTPTPTVTTPPPTQQPTPTPQPTKVPEEDPSHQGGDGGQGGTPVDQEEHHEDFEGPATQPTRPPVEEPVIITQAPEPTKAPEQPTKAPEPTKAPDPTKAPERQPEKPPEVTRAPEPTKAPSKPDPTKEPHVEQMPVVEDDPEEPD